MVSTRNRKARIVRSRPSVSAEQALHPPEDSPALPALAGFVRENPIGGRVIVPGCGAGHEVRLLARSGAEVTGVDMAPEAIETARGFPPAADEQYLCSDWLHLPVSFGQRFDWVVEHLCFGALDAYQRSSYVDAVEFALRRGGQFLGIFEIARPSRDGRAALASEEELNELFSRFWMVAKWRTLSAGQETRRELRLYRRRR